MFLTSHDSFSGTRDITDQQSDHHHIAVLFQFSFLPFQFSLQVILHEFLFSYHFRSILALGTNHFTSQFTEST